MQKGRKSSDYKDTPMKKFLFLILFVPFFLTAEETELSGHIITPKGESSAIKSNKEIVRGFYQVFEKNDSKSLEDFLADNYIVQDGAATYDSTYSHYDAFSKNMGVRLKALHEQFYLLDFWSWDQACNPKPYESIASKMSLSGSTSQLANR